MEILGIDSGRTSIEFPKKRSPTKNKLDIITGPNGSGKTHILSLLAREFIREEHRAGLENSSRYFKTDYYWRKGINLKSDLPPKRLITQTFSPFTRFPREAGQDTSLTSTYYEGKVNNKFYSCIGLHQSYRTIISGLSKRILEESIFRISQGTETARIIFDVMGNLGFRETIKLEYKPTHELISLLTKSHRISTAEAVETLCNNNKKLSNLVSQEARKSGLYEFLSLLDEALHILGRDRAEHKTITHYFGEHNHKSHYDYAILQSIALFRSLGLLRLQSFEIENFNGRRFDITQASSGQQQMLCSIIGLATALKDDSLVLIDEPELSLHPHWQQLYLDHLQASLRPFNGCHVLIATHSPLIVQRSLNFDAGIVQIGQNTHSLELHTPPSIEGTLLEVFETPLSSSTHLANQIFSLINNAESGALADQLKSITELRKIQKIYKNSETPDNKSLDLIDSAIELVLESTNASRN